MRYNHQVLVRKLKCVADNLAPFARRLPDVTGDHFADYKHILKLANSILTLQKNSSIRYTHAFRMYISFTLLIE